jgi:hypothetical protein
MSQPPCYDGCGRLAAGAAAYCAACQPRDTRQQPRASQYGCGACDRIFATTADFDHHQERYPRGHPREGVFTGRCADPASVGLKVHAGVWGTPEGHASRIRSAGRMASVRAAQLQGLAQTA